MVVVDRFLLDVLGLVFIAADCSASIAFVVVSGSSMELFFSCWGFSCFGSVFGVVGAHFLVLVKIICGYLGHWWTLSSLVKRSISLPMLFFYVELDSGCCGLYFVYGVGAACGLFPTVIVVQK